MSKVAKLQERYVPLIGKKMYDTFVEGDQTPTKKYLEYMCKIWTHKKSGNQLSTFTSKNLVNSVIKFDSLLPYIEVKDIYAQQYFFYHELLNVIKSAEKLKEENTFVREEHVKVFLETDEYLFLQPTTYRGSLKYGANTRWCTASKTESRSFTNYTNRGTLAYLISKCPDKNLNYEKLALFIETDNTLSGEVLVYNQQDYTVDESKVLDAGWKMEDWLKVVMTFRTEATNKKILQTIRKEVKTSLSAIERLDLEKLSKQIKFLNESDGKVDSVIKSAEETINKFLKQIEKQIEYAK